MAINVTQLITSALSLMGRLGPGRTAGPSELQAAFNCLNEMIDEWGSERLMVFQTVRQTFSLAPATQTYTIGPGGTFNTTRPTRIETANIIVSGFRLPIELVTADEYSQKILETTLTGQAPRVLYDDYATPLSTLYVWPVPSGSPTLEIFTWQVIGQFATLTDNVAMPAAYLKALRWGLAVAFASEVGHIPPTTVVEGAAQNKQRIERLNKIILDSRTRQAEIDALNAAEIMPGPVPAGPGPSQPGPNSQVGANSNFASGGGLTAPLPR
jgi:hypothetical protein